MTDGEKPQNRINFTAVNELGAYLDHFASEEGAWQQLLSAKDHLCALVRERMYTEEYGSYREAVDTFVREHERKGLEDATRPTAFPAHVRRYVTKSHRPELIEEEAEKLLLEDWGIVAEFANGPQNVINQHLTFDSRSSPIEKANALIDVYTSPSRFSRFPIAKKLGVIQDMGNGIVFPETKGEAIGRCADEIEQWVKANDKVISQREQVEFADALKAYRSANKKVSHVIERTLGMLQQVNNRITPGDAGPSL